MIVGLVSLDMCLCWIFVIILYLSFDIWICDPFFWLSETLSMKGLTLNCMDRKAEAYELVRLGVKACFSLLTLILMGVVFINYFLPCIRLLNLFLYAE